MDRFPEARWQLSGPHDSERTMPFAVTTPALLPSRCNPYPWTIGFSQESYGGVCAGVAGSVFYLFLTWVDDYHQVNMLGVRFEPVNLGAKEVCAGFEVWVLAFGV